MIKQQLLKDLKRAIEKLGFPSSDTLLYIPQNPSFGDYSTNSALQLAKLKLTTGQQPASQSAKRGESPEEIANKIISNLNDLYYLSKIEVAGPGFINFFIKEEFISQEVREILEKGEDFGKNDLGKHQKIQVEFISANPTGPLTLANGRGGALGDTLANVLAWSGYLVEREYYVNDTGNQVRLLGESVLAAAGKIEAKPEHYQGGYVKELAKKFKDNLTLPALELGQLLADYLLEQEIKPAIQHLGIKFDEYYSERSLHEKGLIQKTADLLEEKGLAYEKEGALWFKSSQFGDEKDRVLITSEKIGGRVEPTYLMPDIVHHLEVFKRGYIRRVNILGADHHSYVVRLKQSVEAVIKTEWMDFILIQMVKLIKDGKEFRMSKRAGTYVTLDTLLEAIGKDAVRFFFLMYDPSSHISLDLDLAKEKSKKNPLFYVQYAHARMVNILNKTDVASQASQTSSGEAKLLNHPTELVLIKYLMQFPDLVKEIARTYQVHHLTGFAIKLADLFHRFYENCQVLKAETDNLRMARLNLVLASKIVLANTLRLMGIEAPERM